MAGKPSPEMMAALMEVKFNEERALRYIEALSERFEADPRWLSIARTHLQEGVHALTRAVLKPSRVRLPEDTQSVDPETGLVGEL